MGAVGTRILSVEDDERIRTAVKLALEDEGWTVDEAGSGEEAIELFHRAPPDVVLIDIMLPGIDGFELCRTLRRHSDVPIVMVTARNDTHDVVAGLEAGADDYLTKPFAPKELSARIRALLRRIRPISPGHAKLVFGDLEIIPDEGKVLRGGSELHLTKTEFRLLCELAQNPGRVFSRESLLDKVWGYDYFGDGRLVDVHVRRLRTKVEADPANPRHVVTVRGLGLPPAVVTSRRSAPTTATTDAWRLPPHGGVRIACATVAGVAAAPARPAHPHPADVRPRRAVPVRLPRRGRATASPAAAWSTSATRPASSRPTATPRSRRTSSAPTTPSANAAIDRLQRARASTRFAINYRGTWSVGSSAQYGPDNIPRRAAAAGHRRRRRRRG